MAVDSHRVYGVHSPHFPAHFVIVTSLYKGVTLMASQEMYRLGSQSSVIRELFAYGQEQSKIVGKDKVFDFSIGNPTVPAPACVRKAIEEILRERESAAIHGYTAAAATVPSVRAWLTL